MKEIPVNAREKVLQKKVADPFPEDLKTIESFLDNLAFQKINLQKEEEYIIGTKSTIAKLKKVWCHFHHRNNLNPF